MMLCLQPKAYCKNEKPGENTGFFVKSLYWLKFLDSWVFLDFGFRLSDFWIFGFWLG
jgi:hypothetical protein